MLGVVLQNIIVLKVMTPKYGIVGVPGTHFQHSLLVRQGLNQKIWAKLNVGGRFADHCCKKTSLSSSFSVFTNYANFLYLHMYFLEVSMLHSCVGAFARKEGGIQGF